jgi:general secretion pathway protein G
LNGTSTLYPDVQESAASVQPPTPRPRPARRWRDPRAFSLVETLVVCALLSTLASLAAGIYISALQTARVARAIGDLHALSLDVQQYHLRHGRYPATLVQARAIVPNDPWGRPYVYTDLSQKGSRGKARKDGRLNPINSDFDLYSAGADGRTATPLTTPMSKDDVIRARDGAFLGLAADF